ncbi:flagellin [Ruixingdingia sedimenti]|uniref:Flagellin n=1 Tax=Ruixingdingia sedimenti TaxID=3073604 RepID=A0ABU1F762_9RHOB|nr:flagellin [Xinfangfangia sp. LG-4]MDR5652701.1 flagellin [Xinfangfangia sp. LG-4]
MSSILTNTSAMVALQTLKGINQNLNKTQSEISTGKTVATARDNAAVWSISKVMESDVKGFKGIADSLSLGSSTIAVAREASETITDLLTEIKGKIVAAQEENVDRSKIQTDIAAYRDRITSVVNAAQYNGLNLIKGTDAMNVLASLDRDSAGGVTASQITVSRNDLTMGAGTYGSGTALNANAVVSDTAAGALAAAGNTAQITMATGADYSDGEASFAIGGMNFSFAAGELGDGDQDAAAGIVAGRINALGIAGVTASAAGAVITITSTRAFEGAEVAVSGLGGSAAGSEITELNGAAVTVASGTINERSENVTFSNIAAVSDGDGYRVSFGGKTFTYVAGPGQSMEDVAKGLKTAVDGAGMAGITTAVAQDSNGAWQLKIDNSSTTTMTLAAVGNAGGEASGGLFGLDGIDVTTKEGAAAALSNIEHMITRAIDASASFGSAQRGIDIQNSFVSKLTDSLRAGIGTLVDADMEEASARLQALQVQQQLGIQALSIANQAPQSILSLFR